MATTDEKNWVEEVGAPAYASIVEMVAALECDYERLEELREERDEYNDCPEDERGLEEPDWATDKPDDAAELAELEEAAGECKDRDEAEQRIQEDALSVEVRSNWHEVGGDNTPGEFNILLTTGGPAVRIIGDLDESFEPTSARLEVQDWGKPWTTYWRASEDTLLSYARCFYFGE